MRASSLSYNTIAVNREIDSAYDAVLEVRDNLTNIATLAGLDINTIIADLQDARDFTGITVVAGEVASWDPVTKILTVPTVKGDKGETGDTGTNGLTPKYVFSYNEITGNLEYELDGFEQLSGGDLNGLFTDFIANELTDVVETVANTTEEW